MVYYLFFKIKLVFRFGFFDCGGDFFFEERLFFIVICVDYEFFFMCFLFFRGL